MRLLTAVILFFALFVSCNNKHEERTIVTKIDPASVVSKVETSDLDQSPLDIIYFPVDYPILKMNDNASPLPLARIIYSRPHKKGRKIFGEGNEYLCPYGVEWRLGANEATEIEFFKNVKINKKLLPAGRYILYAIPYADHWKMVFNTNLYSWGLHIEKQYDIFKTDAPVTCENPKENFTINFIDNSGNALLTMQWDTAKATLPLQFNF